MSNRNKEVVKQWFTAAWTKDGYNPETLRKLAADDIVFEYPLQGRHEGIEDIINTLETWNASFPDMNFEVTGDLIAEGDYVAGPWYGGGTHTGAALTACDCVKGTVPAKSGKEIKYSGITIYKVVDGKIKSEMGHEEALDVALILGLLKKN